LEPEEPAEAQVRDRGDGAAAGDDLADALGRNADFAGQPVLRDAQRQEKLLAQQLSGRHGLEAGHASLLQ
jgi:hypothetical protein